MSFFRFLKHHEESMLKIELATVKTSHVLVAVAVLTGTSAGLNVLAQAPRASAPRKSPHSAASVGRRGEAPAQASNPQITAYLQRLRSKLIQAWVIPDGNNHVTITGNFNQDGLSDNIKTQSSPHNENAEQAASSAFGKCLPLEAPPVGMTNGKVTVEFLSNADPHGDSKSSINLRLDPPPASPKAPAASQSVGQPAGEQAQSTGQP
jgi:hypothetical protein